MKARHGLVIGKFYPPHAGHQLLIRTAAAASERVSVVVMAASVESIPLQLRVAWLRELHAAEPNVAVRGIVDDEPVDYGSEAAWRAHVALMRTALAGVTSEAVDAVFTSEAYGQELARRFGAKHVLVDQARGLVPVSGTAVRADPVRCWALLAPPVRAWLTRRLVLIGAESTGKTSAAQAAAAQLCARGGAFASTRWVGEYGRELTIDKLALARAQAALQGAAAPGMDELVWHTRDFVRVAEVQNQREDQAARDGGPILVCDTDAFATGVWHERYLGTRSPEVEAFARRHDLYLLTHPDDVPFQQDGIRDGFAIRHAMTDTFVERLDAGGRRWQWLRAGSLRQRISATVAAADQLLAEGWRLADPLG